MITRGCIREPIAELSLQDRTIITEVETVHLFTNVRKTITGLILLLHQGEALLQDQQPQEVRAAPAEAQEQREVREAADLPEVVVAEDYNKTEIQNKPYRQSL